MLSLLAIASPKRIREISDRTNWKITIEGGWKGDGLYEMVFFFSLQGHWFDLEWQLLSVQRWDCIIAQKSCHCSFRAY